MTKKALLNVHELKVHFYTLRGIVYALEGVTFCLNRQETLGLAGETGCGKSVTARAVLRLIDPPGRIVDGSITFEGRELLSLSAAEMRAMRGSEISMIMQEPKMSLNPVIRVGDQVAETLLIHDNSLNRRSARGHAADMLAQLGIPDPVRMCRRYPHELSGGIAQRIMIAMMLVTRPKLLIADEPTSALDVTIQAQILNLLKALQKEYHLTYLFISHNLGVVRYMSNRIGVMYLGHLVETGATPDVFLQPRHPYTRVLLSSLPSLDPEKHTTRILLEGDPPTPVDPPPGCPFAPRCPEVRERCGKEAPELMPRGTDSSHSSACHFPHID